MQRVGLIILGLTSIWIAFSESQRIVNGLEAIQGQFPWQAAIYVTTPQGTYLCGGALISKKWVVTAAHCLDDATTLKVNLGSIRLQQDDPMRLSESLSLGDTRRHAGYEPVSLRNDIAAISLIIPATYTDTIKPIDLPSTPVEAGALVTVSGWGLTGQGSTASELLNYVDLEVMSDNDCWNTFGVQGGGVVCAVGQDDAIRGTCEGDSGGPLVTDALGQYPVLVGLVSFSNRNGCVSGDPRGFTDVFYYVDWINDVTNSTN